MFQVVPSPIIRSANNYIYSIWYFTHRYYYLPLSWKSWNWFECAVGGVCHPQHIPTNNEDNDSFQEDLHRLGDWAAENAMKINPSKCKAVCFTRARVKNPLNYTTGDQLIPEMNSCKYLGIIFCSDVGWADHVNYMVKKAWKALHFIMRILKKGNSGTKSLAYTTLVHPILEYGAVCWDPYREGQIYVLDRVQKTAAKFAYHMSESNWETLSQRRKISRICALFKAYSGE
jgi:hypothetical protein